MEIFCDENFRFLRQAHHITMPWDRIQGELWLKSKAFRKSLPSNLTTLSSKSNLKSVPRGYCFCFHKDKKCDPGCVYNHNCFTCKGSRLVTDVIFVTHQNSLAPGPNLPTPFQRQLKQSAYSYSLFFSIGISIPLLPFCSPVSLVASLFTLR